MPLGGSVGLALHSAHKNPGPLAPFAGSTYRSHCLSIYQPVNNSRALQERTQPDAFYFGDQLICLALGLRDPAEVDFVTTTEYTRPEQVSNVIETMERDRVRYAVLWDFSVGDPRSNTGPGVNLLPLIAYLRSHYHVARTFPNLDVVWERNP
jgi:hypothetical protein